MGWREKSTEVYTLDKPPMAAPSAHMTGGPPCIPRTEWHADHARRTARMTWEDETLEMEGQSEIETVGAFSPHAGAQTQTRGMEMTPVYDSVLAGGLLEMTSDHQ